MFLSKSKAVLVSLLLGAAALVSPAVAEKPDALTLIVPAQPGGGTDTFGRFIALLMSPMIERPVNVVNIDGGGGTLGVTHLVAARPDGNTLAVVWNGPLTATPHSLTVPYSPENYKPLLSIGYSSYVFCMRSQEGPATAAEFAELLKASEGKLSYAHDGAGGTMQLAAERIFGKIGADVRGVPFGGAGESAAALMAGKVDIYGGSIPPIMPYLNSGEVICPLLTSAGSNPALPGAQGLNALDLAEEETVLWWTVLAPRDMPDDVRTNLEEKLAKTIGSLQFRTLMESKGAVHRIMGSAETEALLQKEYGALAKVAKSVLLRN